MMPLGFQKKCGLRFAVFRNLKNLRTLIMYLLNKLHNGKRSMIPVSLLMKNSQAHSILLTQSSKNL